MQNNISHNPHLNYRSDIDGLRAVAILLVVIFHAFPAFIKGGFIGVDIFFVISGYLITSIIYKAQDTKKFSLIDFYCRRIKRIIPSLLTVLIFCLVFGYFSLLADEYQQLGKHISAGAIYISNFILQKEAGYFSVDAELKPLLHLWSLSIEEQFYLFFPLILIFIKKIKLNKLFVIILFLISSFILNIVEIQNNESEVFFLPYYRIWELLIGSLIAYSTMYCEVALKKINSDYLSIFGSILIVFGWIYLDSKKILFPSWWALLPTIGAASLIISGEKAWVNKNLLANKYMVFIGLISYPLYLWHWPLLAFLRTIEAEKPKATLRLLVLIISILFAWLTYHFIEKKIRFYDGIYTPIFLSICLLSVGYIGYDINQKNGYQNRFSYNTESDKWRAEYNIHHDEYRQQNECKIKYGEFGYCVIKNHKTNPTIMVIGDSHANRLYLTLLNYKKFVNENIINIGKGGCPPFFNLPKKECNEIDNGLDLAINLKSIHTVILTNRYLHFDEVTENFIFNRLERDEVGINENIYRDRIYDTLYKLSKAGKKIIYVLDVPELEFNPTSCMFRPWRFEKQVIREPCAISFEIVQKNREKYQSFIKEIIKNFPSIILWDPTNAFCDDKYCWAVRNENMLYSDKDHINEMGSLYLSDYLNKNY